MRPKSPESKRENLRRIREILAHGPASVDEVARRVGLTPQWTRELMRESTGIIPPNKRGGGWVLVQPARSRPAKGGGAGDRPGNGQTPQSGGNRSAAPLGAAARAIRQEDIDYARRVGAALGLDPWTVLAAAIRTGLDQLAEQARR